MLVADRVRNSRRRMVEQHTRAGWVLNSGADRTIPSAAGGLHHRYAIAAQGEQELPIKPGATFSSAGGPLPLTPRLAHSAGSLRSDQSKCGRKPSVHKSVTPKCLLRVREVLLRHTRRFNRKASTREWPLRRRRGLRAASRNTCGIESRRELRRGR